MHALPTALLTVFLFRCIAPCFRAQPSHHPDQPQVTHQPHQPEEESSDDEGPALADADYDEEEEHARAIRRVEERSKHQKAVLDGTYNEGVVRETWMAGKISHRSPECARGR